MQKYKIYILLIVVFLVIPLGLLTDYSAWGEWELNYFKEYIGYIPTGIEKYSNIFKSLLPDYVFLDNQILSYYLSAITGVALIFGIYFVIYQLIKR